MGDSHASISAMVVMWTRSPRGTNLTGSGLCLGLNCCRLCWPSSSSSIIVLSDIPGRRASAGEGGRYVDSGKMTRSAILFLCYQKKRRNELPRRNPESDSRILKSRCKAAEYGKVTHSVCKRIEEGKQRGPWNDRLLRSTKPLCVPYTTDTGKGGEGGQKRIRRWDQLSGQGGMRGHVLLI